MRRVVGAGVAAAMLCVCGTAAAAVDAIGDELAMIKVIEQTYRGVQVEFDQGRPHVIAGSQMTGGITARDASQFWLQNYGAALGASGSDLVESWSAEFANNASFTVFCYQQMISGLPVEHGIVKVLVLNGPGNPVVYAAGTLAPAPAAGFAPAQVDARTAVALVRAHEEYSRIPLWSKPELVVFQGLGDWTEPVRAWKFVGESTKLADQMRKTFFVDASNGQIVGVRDEVLHDVGGTVSGKGSPGVLPDEGSNPPVLMGMPEIRVTGTIGGTVTSDRNGGYNLVVPPLFPTTVNTGVGGSFGGRWVTVAPTSSSPITAGGVATSPATLNLTLNNSPAQLTTAQVNAFVVTNAIHDYFRDRSGSWNYIDLQLPAHTEVSGTCNAFFNGSSINFFNAGGGCVNTAYSTVIAHEYGHFIVSKLGSTHTGLPQNAFGEGYGDTGAMLLYDVAAVGQDFSGVGSVVRNPVTANRQYPCAGEIHDCGQVLAGTWYGIRQNMGAFYGSATGLNNTRQMEVAWSLITTGGPDSSNSAGPGTLTEVLTADDNDGNLGNGTPNLSRICPAFQAHGINNGNCASGIPNDGCANAILITNGSTPFSTVGASTDGPTTTCNTSGDPQINQDIWYTYTATATGTVSVALCGSTYDTKLAVYNGAGCPASSATEIACNDDSCGLQSQVMFASVIGHQYKIRVGGYLGAMGSGNIVISVVPGNDNCSNAFPISDGDTPFSTEGATTDGPTVSCNGYGDPQVNQDVWYTYTASRTGTCTVGLCGSNYDAKLAVYNGAACPGAANSEIVCDDDGCAFAGPSVVSFPVIGGHQYKIRVGGFLTAFGSGNINISVAPVNDLCPNATVVGNGATAFSTLGAGTDGPAEPNCNFCCNDPQVNQDIWFRYTATCNGTVTVGLCGADYDSKLAAYVGSCPSAAGTAIACNDDSCGLQSQMMFTATAGTQYLIRVGGYTTNAGSGTMTIACAGCYANCDNSTNPPILNVNDFICFQGRFAANDPYANCDGSTMPPILNVNDFICFQNRFATGCP